MEQLPCPEKDPDEHRFGQLFRRGVLLADVEAAEQDPAVGEGGLGGVSEAGLGADGAEVAQGGVPGLAAEGDDDMEGAVEQRQFLG